MGIYLNPDEIAVKLRRPDGLDLKEFELEIPDSAYFEKFILGNTLVRKAARSGRPIHLTLKNNVFTTSSREVSYEAALITDFVRDHLIQLGKRVTFETVLVHEAKIKVLELAIKNGYKNYLYFVGTDSPLINIDRVKKRAMQGGHDVGPDIIIERYYRSMGFLSKAVSLSYRSFIFDNSGLEAKLILEVFDGKQITYHNNEIPNWIDTYFLKKKS